MSWDNVWQQEPWPRVRAFIEHWYADSVHPEDGESEAAIAACESHLEARLPRILKDWYRLLGRRLRPIQDRAVLLSELASESDSTVAIWHENQGVWTIRTPLSPDNPPILVVGIAGCPKKTLSETLLSMLVSETLFGACGERHEGGLGPLATDVRGGTAELNDHLLANLTQHYSDLPFAMSPLFAVSDGSKLIGDVSTIVLIDPNGFWWWATRGERALTTLSRVAGFDRVNAEVEVVVAFECLPDALIRHLFSEDGVPKTQLIQEAIGSADRVVWGQLTVDGNCRFRVNAKDPLHVLKALRTASALSKVLPYMFVATRQFGGGPFTTLHPPGGTFKLP